MQNLWTTLSMMSITQMRLISILLLWAINEVRKNADMPLIPSMGKEDFLERLYNEWRVEFAEDHRFWDVRRWKIADTTQRGTIRSKDREAGGRYVQLLQEPLRNP